MLLHFFLSWPLYDFFCLCLSHSLFLVFAYLSHPLPGSEPDSRAKMEELKKSGLSVRAGGLKDHPNGPSAPPCLALRLSPKTEHLPPLQPPQQQSPGKMGGAIVQEWPCCYGNQCLGTAQSRSIGEEPGLGGGGKAKLHLGLCPPITRPVTLGKSLNLSEPSLPHQGGSSSPH